MGMSTRAGRRLTRPALSLLEMVLVLAILAVMLAIAVPRYSTALGRYHVEAAAERVAADLDAARRVARQTSRGREVVFDSTANTLQYALPSLDGDRVTRTITRLNDTPYRAELVSVDFSGASRVTFDGFGQASSGGQVVVRSHGRERTVTLDASSGEASVR